MSLPLPEDRIEREFHANGLLTCETRYLHGTSNAICRIWYSDGALHSETQLLGAAFHGKRLQWNHEGWLEHVCDYDNGSGLDRSYYNDGKLASEVYIRNNTVLYGPFRTWDAAGDLISETFYIAGGPVSKKHYIEARKTDPTLPPYDAKSASVPMIDQIEEPAVVHHLDVLDDYPDARDALEWLKGVRGKSERRLGELPSAEDSIELVNEYLAAGAERVYAVNVVVDDDGSENTGELIVELPGVRAKKKRQQSLEFCNEQNQSLGFSPIVDSGQKFVHVGLG